MPGEDKLLFQNQKMQLVALNQESDDQIISQKEKS